MRALGAGCGCPVLWIKGSSSIISRMGSANVIGVDGGGICPGGGGAITRVLL